MEKRFVLFMVLTMFIIVSYNLLVTRFGPPPPAQQDPKKAPGKAKADPDPNVEKKPPAPEIADKNTADKNTAENAESPPAKRPAAPHRVVSLGTFAPTGTSPLLVTLNSRGAAIERIELVGRGANGDLRYRDLDNMSGYLGYLSLAASPPKGCRVEVVPAGSPAALAEPSDNRLGRGLQVGDLLTSVNGKRVSTASDFELELSRMKPKQSIKLEIIRQVDGKPLATSYQVELAARPFPMIQPEPLEAEETARHPHSMLLAIRESGNNPTEFLHALRDVDWELVEPVNNSSVEFRYSITAEMADELGLSGPVDLFKRYRLGTPLAAGANAGAGNSVPAYHLEFEIGIVNQGEDAQKLAYRLDGVNGLPTEGWWYLAKINRAWFSGAGARDVVLYTQADGHRLLGCPAIFKRAKNDEKSPDTPLFSENERAPNRTWTYLGVDTQYFASALLPMEKGRLGQATSARAEAVVHGDPSKKPKGWERTANVSFQLISDPIALDPKQAWNQKFVLFAGPKDPDLLSNYELDHLVYYGWFGSISKFLGMLLHFFHNQLVGNYAVAIVLLTVLVRGCMFPISRKAAKNAAMMQELAPELKKIAENNKTLEARQKAQQELFRQHNYNPLGGCWLMFLQLPVFIGLYRCLAVDIELRQAPLIRGMEWCSNLAGPDKLFYWKTPFFSWFSDESGWLGPYFNLLPIFTIALFLVQQKLFTPPATDENTAMQLKIMKVMTIFMGVLFYKVPAGLCIYFITSSLWGIAERKLLPKPKAKLPASVPTEPKKKKPSLLESLIAATTAPKSNGSDEDRKKYLRKQKRK